MMVALSSPTQRLAWSHPPEPMQGAASFASRVAALNGRPMPNFLREMGIYPNDIDRGRSPAVRRLAEIAGANADDLVRATPVRSPDAAFTDLCGERLRRLSVHRTYFRYCPACVAEDVAAFEGPVVARPWLRTEWIVSHVRSCDRHGILLANASPERRRFEAPDFNGTMAEDLGRLDGIRAGCPTVPSSPFQRWLLNRLRGERDASNWLDGLELYVAIGACEGLGVSALHPPKVKASTLTETDWAAAADEGFAHASGGPAAVERLLARLNAAQTGTRGVWAPRDTFGYGYVVLERDPGDPAWDPVRDVVVDFAMREMPLEAGTKVLGRVVERQAVHTIRTAARASGAHALTVRRLFERENLGADALAAGLMDHRVTVDAERIEATVRELKGALSTPKVQKLTGFPLIWLRAIIADGHLPTVTGSNDREFAKHRFTRQAVDEMLERMFAGAEAVDTETDDRVNVLKARHRTGATMSKILEPVFGGTLRWKGRLAGAVGLDALLVDVAEFLPLVRNEERGNGINLLDILDFLPGIGRDSPKALLASGLLELEMQFSPEARRMVPVITRESAERFLRRYVTLGELCQRTGLHHKQVRKRLREDGVPEEMTPQTHKCFAYDRQQVDRAAAWTKA
ncbi:TniQ family protein [Mangrovicella endophytica]|uniref:TniQ family protein n=1 Tax=Mangrovicella endophytica TaxID=2066697 RepID=UPI000C9E2080|nr:TniQ family protein [Mangrovicella endophytica]